MTTVLWLDDLEMQAWRSLLSAHSRLMSRLDAELQASQGMSVSDYGVLVQLSEAEGGHMRMSELADRLLLSPSGLTRRLDGLVRAGLVDRARCPTDRRGAFAVLTDAGRGPTGGSSTRSRRASPTSFRERAHPSSAGIPGGRAQQGGHHAFLPLAGLLHSGQQ